MQYSHQCPDKLFTIALRLKPSNTLCSHINSNSIMFNQTKEIFHFDHIFNHQSTSHQIHSQFQYIISDFFNGLNGCICAYGQTSSGKTYTMKGTQTNPGLIPLTFKYIFQNQLPLKKRKTIRISYLEIYNELIYDLLSDTKNQIDIKSQFQANEIEVHTYEQFQSIYDYGETQRQYGCTRLNENSSRSHVILSIKSQSSELVFADLAGSENVNKVSSLDSRRKESLMINKSLLALQTVVAKLRENKNQYVNFRDSKLTRILQNNLTGNSQTIILLTVNSQEENIHETINTLRFGVSIGAVKSARQSTPLKSSENSLSALQSELSKAMNKIKDLQNEKCQQETEIQSLKVENQNLQNRIEQEKIVKNQQASINSQLAQSLFLKLNQEHFNLLDFESERMFQDKSSQTDSQEQSNQSFYKNRISQIEKEINQLERQYDQHLFLFNLELEQINQNDDSKEKLNYLHTLKENNCLKNECLQKAKQIYLLTLSLQDKKEQLSKERQAKYDLEKKMYELHQISGSKDNVQQKIQFTFYNGESLVQHTSKKEQKGC